MENVFSMCNQRTSETVFCVEGAKYKVCGEGCQWQCALEETRRKEEKTRSFAKSASQEVFVPIYS